MEIHEPQAEGLLATARYIASQKTPFRTYTRLVSGVMAFVLISSLALGAQQFWGSYPVHAQPLPVIENPVAEGLKPSIPKSILEDYADEATRAEAPTVSDTTAITKPAANVTSLDEVISRWQSVHPGVKLGVMVKEIDGAGRQASSNENEQFFAASLYKLYIIHYLYDRIEQGSLESNSKLGTEKTVNECIDAMILVSDNVCAVGVANSVGWDTIDTFVHNKGFKNTSLRQGIVRASAADTSEYMIRLQTGTLINSEHSAHLIDLMKRQIHRQAIPQGVTGTVADKSGYYGISWHDTAIVYGPKSTYVLSILTSGSGAQGVADLAKQISDYLNR